MEAKATHAKKTVMNARKRRNVITPASHRAPTGSISANAKLFPRESLHAGDPGVRLADDALVVTVTEVATAFVPSGVTDAGDTVQTAPFGAPVHVNETF